MSMPATKAALWEAWIERTVLADITAADTPDPVPMLDESADEPTMSPAYDDYRLGRGSGDYLYLLYLLDEPAAEPTDVIPVYIGETQSTSSRLLDHFRRLRDALPIADWEDDGSWGSFGKYDHIATVTERASSPLYAWVVDAADVERGPYGFDTYRQELEAKTVGLAHSYPAFDRVFANRDFVPNQVPQRMGTVGPAWVEDPLDGPRRADGGAAPAGVDPGENTKTDLWHDWVAKTILADIRAGDTRDPIPLFETDDDGTVALTEAGSSTVLKRSDAIDARIRQEGERCVHPNGITGDYDGLLYVMFQLAGDDPGPTDVIPRYIGKAEASGKKNELSANFGEIAKGRTTTRSFARWGDGSYWHVGELSETVFGEDSKKQSWACELFEQGTHRLKEETYLWIRAWNADEHPGPYGYPAYLAEIEALLIGLVYEAYPDQLLNHKEVPNDAPANRREYAFEPASQPD